MKKGWIRVVALAAAVGFLLSQTISVGAQENLRPPSASKDGRTVKDFSYGLKSEEEKDLFHREFKKAADAAYANGRAINLIGHLAVESLEEAAEKYMQMNRQGYIAFIQEFNNGIARLQKREDYRKLPPSFTQIDPDWWLKDKTLEISERLNDAKDTLTEALDDKTLLTIIDELPTDSPNRPVEFINEVLRIRQIKDKDDRIKEARKLLVDDTRYTVFLFGKRPNEISTINDTLRVSPSLYSLGDIATPEYKAFISHMGTFEYPGSENVIGGARTMYFPLGRIEALVNVPSKWIEPVEVIRRLIRHEFKSYAKGGHVDELPRIMAWFEEINREADRGPVITPAASVARAQAPKKNEAKRAEAINLIGDSDGKKAPVEVETMTPKTSTQSSDAAYREFRRSILHKAASVLIDARSMAESLNDFSTKGYYRGSRLKCAVAKALIKFGAVDEGEELLKRVDWMHERALGTTDDIEDMDIKHHASLSGIVAAMGELDKLKEDVDKANKLIDSAIENAKKINFPYLEGLALAHIAETLVKLSGTNQAVPYKQLEKEFPVLYYQLRYASVAAVASALTAIDPNAPEKTKKEMPRGLIYSEEFLPVLPSVITGGLGLHGDLIAVVVPDAAKREQLKSQHRPYFDASDILFSASVEEAKATLAAIQSVMIITAEVEWDGGGGEDKVLKMVEKFSLKSFKYFTTKEESVPAGVDLVVIEKKILDALGKIANKPDKLKEFEKEVEFLYQL